MSDVTRILNAIEQGNAKAADKLLPLVYEELRLLRVARAEALAHVASIAGQDAAQVRERHVAAARALREPLTAALEQREIPLDGLALRRIAEALVGEARRQEELRQIEELRKQRMEDDDDPSLVGMVTEEQLRKANPLLLEQSIYFDFDRYQIKAEYAPIIAAHARFLIAHPTVKIFVEGNCDDRGSPEYNIALGQRRADVVQRALLALGVPKRQVEAVSYGAERPIAYGANEESWARNRRADIAYPMFKN